MVTHQDTHPDRRPGVARAILQAARAGVIEPHQVEWLARYVAALERRVKELEGRDTESDYAWVCPYCGHLSYSTDARCRSCGKDR